MKKTFTSLQAGHCWCLNNTKTLAVAKKNLQSRNKDSERNLLAFSDMHIFIRSMKLPPVIWMFKSEINITKNNVIWQWVIYNKSTCKFCTKNKQLDHEICPSMQFITIIIAPVTCLHCTYM